MWRFVTSLVGRTRPSPAEVELELKREEQLLEATTADFDRRQAVNDSTAAPLASDARGASTIRDEECFTARGRITMLGPEHGTIDDAYFFDRRNVGTAIATDELHVGHIVRYLGYRLSDDIPVQVMRIEAIEYNDWSNPGVERTAELVEELREQRPQVFAVSHRSVHGEVVGRRKRFVTIDLGNGKQQHVDLDEVRMSFVPVCGDLVVLDCKVQEDPSFVDMAGDVLHVMSVHPTRTKCEEGTVTDYNDGTGVGSVNRQYRFDETSLDLEYTRPQKGDRVSVEAIEHNSEMFAWRCVKVVLMAATEPKVEHNDANAISVQEQKEMKENKGGLEVSEDLRFNFSALGEHGQLTMRIHNTSDKPHKLLRARFNTQSVSQSQVRLVRPTINHTFTIPPGKDVEYVFEARAKYYGHSTENIIFHFAQNLRIMRHIHLKLIDQSGTAPSIGTGSNVYRNKAYTHSVWTRQLDIVPGVGLGERLNFVAVQLGSWEVPHALADAVLKPFSRSEIDENLSAMLPQLAESLHFRMYEKCMHALLHLEEIECYHMMRRYDRDRAHFNREGGQYLSLVVPNMAEARPSLVLGDYVLATNPWQTKDGTTTTTASAPITAHRGDIHKVLGDRILLRFNENFHNAYNGEDYKLVFRFSRTPMRKCHYAVQKTVQKMQEEFLFPTCLVKTARLQLDVDFDPADGDAARLIEAGRSVALPWFNERLNIVQMEAIKNVLRGEARPMPYVIFGPPGTGKTSTLIETILQLFAHVPDSRLLVAAPSNSAANLITQRLVECGHLKSGDFVRVASFNAIEMGRIPDELLPYTATCNIAREGTVDDAVRVLDSGVKLRCNVSVLGRHRITIGTCTTLGTLMQMEFARDHFTHVLVDEAGQCTEPEVLIPITFVNRNSGQVVLFGDPMQLGPVVLSRFASERGLQQSLLVRLLDRFPYQMDRERFERGYDPRLVTKLLYCYRSLPSIMGMFSRLFYHGELLETVCPKTSAEAELLQRLDGVLPGQGERTDGYGVFFWGCRGENLQDLDSPSWYNAVEAKSVLQFFLKLRRAGVSEDDIGIITPYTKQAKVIRNLIAEQDLKVPKIGTVEEFQGQERMVVILSTVRSSSTLLREDRKHQLGFVSHPKRLNVGISRARALLMIVGDPHLLAKDSSWRFVIKGCVKNNTYVGCDFAPELLERRSKPKAQPVAEDKDAQ